MEYWRVGASRSQQGLKPRPRPGFRWRVFIDRLGNLAEVVDRAHSVNWRGEAFHSGLDLQR
jgi:hypothetical protein